MKRLVLAATLTLASFALPAMAQDIGGEWGRDSGASRIAFAPCGNALCGTITWLRDANGPARVGQQVYFDMKPSGENEWTGKAFNPEDGKTYSGKMRLNGNRLVTEGCVFILCKSVEWVRN
ncbi:Uncharacterized conserved protein, DUF2147 family [Devosia sp. YR412]|uniref:DUF2147 domain-containing protein n=1 Tax=Devosia sp. YR412 TaxID=1881030 RepID=UPI0008BD4313|nr:DUF2147 domain-containing protein [Devosia sp. YR412]SEQ42672.1 Uncharacterized conserved protein, DUF2147 family [Devosia sp. YR412]